MRAALYSPRTSICTTPSARERITPRTPARCRACAREALRTILDFGRMPLANALLTESQLSQPEAKISLQLAFCAACALVQITETVPGEILFREYPYFSSNSETVLEQARELSARTIESRKLGAKSLVIEIASNDGYLLQFYKRAGIPVLGIEPAKNIACIARERGIRTVSQFFRRSLAANLRRNGLLADVVHANNVLAHASDLDGFLAGLRWILKAEGVAVIEVPYVKEMIERMEFDTIYHEHLSYFSLASLEELCAAHDLTIVDVERLEIHGGSLRVHVEHAGNSPRSRSVERLAAKEIEAGVSNFAFYDGFAERAAQLKEKLVSELRGLKTKGMRLAAYGASAKGTTLLNYCKIGADFLEFVVDRSAAKQGLYTPGTHLPIYAPEKLLEAMPDYVLLLTWNFADEILRQQEEYRRRGGRFIIPIPEPRVI